MSGFAAAQDKLEAVSSTKGQVDSTKGQTLDELSRVVGEITSKLAVSSTERNMDWLCAMSRVQRSSASSL